MDKVIEYISNCDKNAFLKIQDVMQKKAFSLGLNKFAKGKIYKIRHCVDQTDVAYVGSTIKLLAERFSGHKRFIRYFTDSKLAEYVSSRGGIHEYEIELVENYPCKSFLELLEREKYHINIIKPACNVAMRDFIDDMAEDGEVLEAYHNDVISKRKMNHILKTRQQERRDKWIADLLKCTDATDRNIVQKLMADNRNRILIWNHICEIEQGLLSACISFPFKEELLPDDITVKIKSLYQNLGVSSSDNRLVIKELNLLQKLDANELLCSDLMSLMGLKSSTSKTTDRVRRVKLNIDIILSAFAGCKLEGTRRQHRADGRKSHYDYMFVDLPEHRKVKSIVIKFVKSRS